MISSTSSMYTSLRTGIMAGSPCPILVMRQVMEKMHMTDVTICYGLTEGSPVMTQTRIHDDIRRRTERRGPGNARDRGQDRGPGDQRGGRPGRTGRGLLQGLQHHERAITTCPKPRPRPSTARAGCTRATSAVMDEKGFVAITGRLKDMIIRGGENIYPREIEEFLYNMPGISDVQVAGVRASRKYGEEVGAFIVPKEGSEIALEDVRDYCRGQIAWHKIPKYIHILNEYPMTASGKVQKYKLREMAAELFPDA